MTGPLRVFVNERPVDVARGARVRDAVAALDHALADLLTAGNAYVTDAVGRPVDGGDAVGEAGAVFRVVVSARQGPPRLTKDDLHRWPKVELHVHLDGCLRLGLLPLLLLPCCEPGLRLLPGLLRSQKYARQRSISTLFLRRAAIAGAADTTVASVLFAVSSWRKVSGGETTRPATPSKPARKPAKRSVTDRFEDRWRRRREQG